MSELTALREAVDELAQSAVPPQFGDLERRATRRGRRRTALVVAASVAALAGLALVVHGFDDNGRPSPGEPIAPTPGPRSSEADQIIADGALTSFAASASGTVITVWDTCDNQFDTACGNAWRLSKGSQTLATGVAGHGDVHMEANAAERGFLLTPAGANGPALLVSPDGAVTSPAERCEEVTWSVPTEPGRFLRVPGPNFADTTTGAICATERLGAQRFLANYTFTSDGTLWALLDNERGPETLTIGKYDGTNWQYHSLAGNGGAWMSVLAAAGPKVVVIQAENERVPAPDHLVGLSVTTDAGATWHEVTAPDDVATDLPFHVSQNPEDWFSGYTTVAFAGTSTLFLADGSGALWRSTDLVTFSKVSLPGKVTDPRVSDLKPAGEAVIARLDDGNDLIRISADGTAETITSR